MNKLIIPTGYMGSGSSAITDILSEYDSINVENADFEYVFLHCPNGLFDLEDKLLIGNNAVRSDEAIHNFLETMKSLYRKDFHWISNYKNKVSSEFYQYCTDFIDQLSIFKSDKVYWYYQQNPVNTVMRLKLLFIHIIRRITNDKVRINRPLSYRNTCFAIPTADQFYNASREFLNKFYTAMGRNENNILLDQLVLPHNLFRLNRYFDDDVRIIVVERDPRDVYILNKYIWMPNNNAVPYPLDCKQFCEMYKRIRDTASFNDSKILSIHFEDLIYNYDSSLNQIESFIGLDSSNHNNIRSCFNPDVSIHNTQLFKRKEFYDESIRIIESELSDYLYSFPNSLETEISVKALF